MGEGLVWESLKKRAALRKRNCGEEEMDGFRCERAGLRRRELERGIESQRLEERGDGDQMRDGCGRMCLS